MSIDELEKECNINEYGDIDENGHYIFKRFREILAQETTKARIDQAAITSGWIVKNIEKLRPMMLGETSGVVITYAVDQARQARYKTVAELRKELEQ